MVQNIVENIRAPTCNKTKHAKHLGINNRLWHFEKRNEGTSGCLFCSRSSELSVRLEIFCAWRSEPLQGFHTDIDVFAVVLLDLYKVFLTGEKPGSAGCCSLFRKRLALVRRMLLGFLGQELSSPHNIRLLTKVLTNHTYGGFINPQIPGECPNWLHRILSDTTDEFRRPENDS